MSRTQYNELKAERAELEFKMLQLDAELREYGCDYGQAPQRIVDASEYAEDALKYWDIAFSEELKSLHKLYKEKCIIHHIEM